MTGRSDIDPDLLRRRYLHDGATVREIAAELGRDRAQVYRALARDQIPLRGKPGVHEWGDVLTHEYLSGCLADGMTRNQIAEETGASWPTVAEWMATHRLSDILTDQEREQVRRWYEDEGCSIATVAARMMVGTRTARRYLLEAGATLRPRGRPAGR